MIVSYIFTGLAYVLILLILILNILAQRNYEKSKTVFINNPAPVCTFGQNIPTINTDSLTDCKTKAGNVVPNYFVYSNQGNSFVVSEKEQVFYTKICNKYCPQKLTNGNCNKQTQKYTNCLQLLEPPKGCKNPAQAIFINEKGKPYFAADIFPSTSLGCVSS